MLVTSWFFGATGTVYVLVVGVTLVPISAPLLQQCIWLTCQCLHKAVDPILVVWLI